MNRRLNVLAFAASASLVVALLGCGGAQVPTFDKPLKLGGASVSAETLNQGAEAYTLYCRACHGDKGDGHGPAAEGLRPAPRDFRQGTFKFGWVKSGSGLPHDEDIVRIVRGGLHGTAMLKWEIPDDKLNATIQYIKTFSDEWKGDDAQLGEQVKPGADPWAGKDADGVARGKIVYHGFAQCSSCHPAYATKQEIYDASLVFNKKISDFRPNLYLPEVKGSDYTIDGAQKAKFLPPDFTFSKVRSIREGSEVNDLYCLVGAGIPGTAMPAWKGALPEEDLWALAHYVKSLMDLRDTPKAAELQKQLLGQPEWAPPADAAAPAAPVAPTRSGM